MPIETKYKHTLVIGSGKNMKFDAAAVSWNSAAAQVVEFLRRVYAPLDYYPDRETRIKMEYMKILASGKLTAIIRVKKDVFNSIKMSSLIEASKNKSLLDITLILQTGLGTMDLIMSNPVWTGQRLAHVKLQQAQILSVITSKGGYILEIDGSAQSRGGSIPFP
jgi:hypothetical protein